MTERSGSKGARRARAAQDARVAGPVAVIGAGMIGRSWSIAFARRGHPVRLHDPDAAALRAALAAVAEQLGILAANGLLGDAGIDETRERVVAAASLEAAVDGAIHVQESAPERVELKRELFAALDALAPSETTLASSTSALLPSAFLEGVTGVGRCLVAHPLNPPHLIPAVELVPHAATEPATLARAAALFESIGQRVIVLEREIEGFLMNRLQGALLEEALRLVESGLVGIEDVDVALRDGLGMRWSFMGPFETIDLNAPGGIADYVARYGPAYRSIAAARGGAIAWDEALAARLERARRALLPAAALAERRDWRDRELVALAVHRRRAGAARDEQGAVAP